MTEPSDDAAREPGEFEYPDEAGYPDGAGVLDEGTEDAPDLSSLEEFGAGDEEDVEDV